MILRHQFLNKTNLTISSTPEMPQIRLIAQPISSERFYYAIGATVRLVPL